MIHKQWHISLLAVALIFSPTVVASHDQATGGQPHPAPESGSKLVKVEKAYLEKLGITDPSAFGEAYRDRRGLVWGSAARGADGSFQRMTLAEAEEYCQRIGARLPSGWPSDAIHSFQGRASDFDRLAVYLGKDPRTGKGYQPAGLPDLTFKDKENKIQTMDYASSKRSHAATPGVFGYYFDGATGQLLRYQHAPVGQPLDNEKAKHFVRCVVGRD